MVEGANASRHHPFIQSCTLDDEPLQEAWLMHAQLLQSDLLHCEMGPEPSDFGTMGSPPPSLSTNGLATP